LLFGAGPYIVGPGDKLSVTVRDLKDLEFQPAYVQPDGSVEFTYGGRIMAGGFTPEEIGREVENRLRAIVRDPKVIVDVTEYGSQSVSVLGAVRKPGMHQLRGGRTLTEVLALAEGVNPDAGSTVSITRPKGSGQLPLKGTTMDVSGNYYVAGVNLHRLLDGSNPEANIVIHANDVVSVSRSEVIYVVGNVRKPGGFSLLERESITALQALALAEGLDPTAAPQKATILRAPAVGGERREIPLDLRKILANKAKDQPLQPNDILFIPNSSLKSVGRRALDMGVQMATGVVIFRR
jgi:polysaccharide export outer membrane protein